MEQKTLVIAEAACTWRIGKPLGQPLYAAKSIQIAKECGAQVWKTQWVSDPRQMEARRKVPPGTYDILHWPVQWLERFKKTCDQVGIEFMCTAFLPQDVAVIAPYVNRFKVASLECRDEALQDAMDVFTYPVIISTGAMGYDMIPLLNQKLLHCVAAYPAPPEAMNLAVLRGGRQYHGLSDHSGDLLTGALAVAAGAEIVEVHFRLDETRKDNPDYGHSHAPLRLTQYVYNIRKAEAMMGDGVKKVEACERPMLAHRVTA